MDASASTAPGSFAFVDRFGDSSLVAVADRRAAERGPVPLGAFSTHPDANDLGAAVDDQLRRFLGSRRFGV